MPSIVMKKDNLKYVFESKVGEGEEVKTTLHCDESKVALSICGDKAEVFDFILKYIALGWTVENGE